MKVPPAVPGASCESTLCRLGVDNKGTDIAAGCVVVTSFVTAESGRQEPVKRSVCLKRGESEVLDLAPDAPVPVK